MFSIDLILFQEEATGDITFYMKGADVAMASIVQYNDWLEEEVRKHEPLLMGKSAFCFFVWVGELMNKSNCLFL